MGSPQRREVPLADEERNGHWDGIHPRPWIPKGLGLLSTIHVELHISDASKSSQTGGCLGLDPCFPSFLLLLSHSAFAFS